MLEKALGIVGISEDYILLTAAIHNHLAQIQAESDDSENAELHKKEFEKLKEKIDSMHENEHLTEQENKWLQGLQSFQLELQPLMFFYNWYFSGWLL